jgi:hypothetical protein
MHKNYQEQVNYPAYFGGFQSRSPGMGRDETRPWAGLWRGGVKSVEQASNFPVTAMQNADLRENFITDL